jgi:death-on-curing protein
MTRFLTVEELLQIHRRVIAASGGTLGLRDGGGLEAAAAQPRMTFGGDDLYPALAEKAAALAFSLSKNHPFLDGNKRVAHATLETFLVLNGHELSAGVDEQERVILALAAGELDRDAFSAWVCNGVRQRL